MARSQIQSKGAVTPPWPSKVATLSPRGGGAEAHAETMACDHWPGSNSIRGVCHPILAPNKVAWDRINRFVYPSPSKLAFTGYPRPSALSLLPPPPSLPVRPPSPLPVILTSAPSYQGSPPTDRPMHPPNLLEVKFLRPPVRIPLHALAPSQAGT